LFYARHHILDCRSFFVFDNIFLDVYFELSLLLVSDEERLEQLQHLSNVFFLLGVVKVFDGLVVLQKLAVGHLLDGFMHKPEFVVDDRFALLPVCRVQQNLPDVFNQLFSLVQQSVDVVVLLDKLFGCSHCFIVVDVR